MLGYTKAYNPANILIERELGAGGYGKVYLCSRRDRPEQKFAVKRLFVHSVTDFLLSYREIDIAKKMDHPHIIPLIGYCLNELSWSTRPPPGERDDDICLIFPAAMCDLADLPGLHEKPETEILGIFSQILSGVAHIHYCGYFHRDIKPSNVLCMADGTVKLCDFGVSEKMFKHNYVTAGLGSFQFRAPEMLLSFGVNWYQSDVWSLGCLLYYMLSGAYVGLSMNKPENRVAEMQNIIDGYPFPIDLPMERRMSGVEYRCVSTLISFEGKIRVKLSNPSVFRRYLARMLALNPENRPTVAELLKHSYISRHRNDVVKDIIVSPVETRQMKACNPVVMSRVQNSVFDAFFGCSSALWYRDAVVFTSLVIFDRLVAGVEEEILLCASEEWNKYFKTCLYISAKYYSSAHCYDMDYRDFALPQDSPSSRDKAREFERAVMVDLGGWIYDISVYDILLDERDPSFDDIFCLLLFVLSGRHDKKTAKEAYLEWKKSYDHLVILARQHPRYPR